MDETVRAQSRMRLYDTTKNRTNELLQTDSVLLKRTKFLYNGTNERKSIDKLKTLCYNRYANEQSFGLEVSMTWEILMGLLTLLTALAGLAKTITNNTRALTEIRCTVSALNDTVLQQRRDLGAIREQLQNLILRVHDLEREMGEGGRHD